MQKLAPLLNEICEHLVTFSQGAGDVFGMCGWVFVCQCSSECSMEGSGNWFPGDKKALPFVAGDPRVQCKFIKQFCPRKLHPFLEEAAAKNGSRKNYSFWTFAAHRSRKRQRIRVVRNLLIVLSFGSPT